LVPYPGHAACYEDQCPQHDRGREDPLIPPSDPEPCEARHEDRPSAASNAANSPQGRDLTESRESQGEPREEPQARSINLMNRLPGCVKDRTPQWAVPGSKVESLTMSRTEGLTAGTSLSNEETKMIGQSGGLRPHRWLDGYSRGRRAHLGGDPGRDMAGH
jgi:hypothetical protein